MSALQFTAVCFATFAMLVARAVVPPRRRLSQRLRPYAALSRSRLGTGYADVSVVALSRPSGDGTMRQVFGPIIHHVAAALGSLIDVADNNTLSTRLSHAGFVTIDPDQYRMRQLGYTVGAVAVGCLTGISLFGTPAAVLAFAVLFGFPGATLQRNRVERAIRQRCSRMETETYTIAQLLAVHVRAGHGPVDAVRVVCGLGRGPVIVELREALRLIASGTPPQRAYARLADTTAAPAAARLYRLLAASAQTGGDIANALLAVSDELRNERRESIARTAVKRRTMMLLPLLLFIAPVMVLYVGAALPSLVLGAP